MENNTGHNSYIPKLVGPSAHEILVMVCHSKFGLPSPINFGVGGHKKLLLTPKLCLKEKGKYYKPFLTSPRAEMIYSCGIEP